MDLTYSISALALTFAVREEPHSFYLTLLMMIGTAGAVSALVIWLLVVRAKDAAESHREERDQK